MREDILGALEKAIKVAEYADGDLELPAKEACDLCFETKRQARAALESLRSTPQEAGEVVGDRNSPHNGQASLTEEDVLRQPAEVLAALRARPSGDRITIWKDGTWKRWAAQDAIYARSEADWCSEIPTEELSVLHPAPTPGGAGELVEALRFYANAWATDADVEQVGPGVFDVAIVGEPGIEPDDDLRADKGERARAALAGFQQRAPAFKEGRASSPGGGEEELRERLGGYADWISACLDGMFDFKNTARPFWRAMRDDMRLVSEGLALPPPDTGSIYLSAPALSESDKRSEPISCDGWRTMESAPINQAILIFVPGLDYYGNGGVYAGMLVDMGTGRRWMSFAWAMGRDHGPDVQPTHWRSLPLPPSAANEATPRPDGSAQDQTQIPLRHEGDAGLTHGGHDDNG